jgi:hypothetical protein
LPIAITWSPARKVEESPNAATPRHRDPRGKIEFEDRHVEDIVTADDCGRHLRAVGQRDG